jgi:hypothetical protein
VEGSQTTRGGGQGRQRPSNEASRRSVSKGRRLPWSRATSWPWLIRPWLEGNEPLPSMIDRSTSASSGTASPLDPPSVISRHVNQSLLARVSRRRWLVVTGSRRKDAVGRDCRNRNERYGPLLATRGNCRSDVVAHEGLAVLRLARDRGLGVDSDGLARGDQIRIGGRTADDLSARVIANDPDAGGLKILIRLVR